MDKRVEVICEQPPIIDAARRVFRLPDGAVFAYSPYIYNPSNNLIDIFLYKHECVHITQQGNDPDKWWQRYFNDNNFRKEQEISAYQVQYKEAQKIIKDKNALFRYVLKLAGDFSSEMYGLNMSKSEALRLIKHGTL